jgi:hypothetical protein
MAQDLELALRIHADVRRANREIQAVRQEVARFGQGGRRTGNDLRDMGRGVDQAERSTRNLGVTARQVRGLLASLGIAISARSIIQATVRQEQALAQLDARIRSTGGSAGFTRDELAGMAAELQKVTTFGDEAVMEMQATLMTFTRVTNQVFRDSQELILDLATAMRMDLNSAALQVGKALNDPIQGLTALRRAGIQFTDDQETMIRRMVETNDLAGAQRVILRELETQFGGAARAARDTFGGALAGLRNAFGDLLEADGGLGDAREQIERLTEILKDPQVIEGINALVSGVVRLTGVIAELTAAGVRFTQWVGEELAVAIHGVAADDVERIEQRLASLRQELALHEMQPELFGRARKGLRAEIEEYEQMLERALELRHSLARPDAPAAPGAPAAAPVAAPTPTGPSDDFLKAQSDLERRIGLLGRESAEQQMIWEVEQGRYRDLAQGEKDALLALAARLDAGNEAIRQAEEEARAAKEAEAAQKAYDDELERAARAIRDVLDPMEPLRRELEQLNLLLEEGKLSWDEWAEATLRVHERMDAMSGAAQGTGESINEFAVGAARNMQRGFADYLFDPFDEGLKGMVAGFVRAMHRMLSEYLAMQAMTGLFGASFGTTGQIGGIVGSLFHTGGIAGQGGATRTVHPALFARAARYHGGGVAGLAPDEIPAILRRGEEVLTEDDPRHRTNFGAAAGGRMEVDLALSEGLVVQAMRSRDVEQAILRVISRNRGAVLQEIG